MKTKVFLTRLIVVVWLVLGVACGRPSQERSVDLTVPVTVTPATLSTIESTITATGTLRSVREAPILAEVKGDLFLVEVKGLGRLSDGVAVTEGQAIARIENDEWIVGANVASRKLARQTAQHSVREKEALFARGLATEFDVNTAKKTLADAEASYEEARIKVRKTAVHAPISGVMTEVSQVTQGTEIQVNAVIGKVVDYSKVLVDLRIPNSQVLAIKLGKPVRVSNYAFSESVFDGKITAVDPVLDPVTRTLRVVATVDNPDLMLRPGMFVKTEIVKAAHTNVVVVSKKLVVKRQNQDVVFVEESARAQMRTVETGLESRDSIEIADGIEEGDRLITSNYETLRARTRVRVTTSENP
ncbi:MAG: efflux RND transporter periplasmic adaptor subunit [Candidatus Latescibacterota bacterium]|nr:efflux RND transporter periplasmic adaptor subunit [Candidatus Latescibacterota bacterium]